jgi:hypothetical protein
MLLGLFDLSKNAHIKGEGIDAFHVANRRLISRVTLNEIIHPNKAAPNLQHRS